MVLKATWNFYSVKCLLSILIFTMSLIPFFSSSATLLQSLSLFHRLISHSDWMFCRSNLAILFILTYFPKYTVSMIHGLFHNVHLELAWLTGLHFLVFYFLLCSKFNSSVVYSLTSNIYICIYIPCRRCCNNKKILFPKTL